MGDRALSVLLTLAEESLSHAQDSCRKMGLTGTPVWHELEHAKHELMEARSALDLAFIALRMGDSDRAKKVLGVSL